MSDLKRDPMAEALIGRVAELEALMAEAWRAWDCDDSVTLERRMNDIEETLPVHPSRRAPNESEGQG